MTVWERYADACLRVAEARGEVTATSAATYAAEGTPIHATMKAVEKAAENRLFAAEGEAVEYRKAVLIDAIKRGAA